MKNTYDYLVVGSGLYGAIFAHEAKAHGKSVLVVDKRPNIAGNIYTENVEGINVHKYGAHIFHTNNKNVWNYITQFAEFNRFTNSPVANYKGELYSLPFNMYTFNKMWGVVTPEEAASKIEEQRKEITGEPQNLEEQAISLVGRDIYEKLIKGYTEKQWGRDCKELPSFIIKRLPKVYVTDNHTDYDLSPAKKYADVAWDVSWSDLDTLEQMCRKEGIDGITAGYSEIRVENVIKLCKRLDLPCYTTMEQLEITRDKIKFKNECRLNGVPVVKEYKTIEDVDAYPVIVKPVDRAGSIGISVAHDKEELKRAYDYAMDMSLCKEVIIEEYIYKAVKFDAYYEIIDGKIELISTDDVINGATNFEDSICWAVCCSQRQCFHS